MEWTTTSSEETRRRGRERAGQLRVGDLLLLTGELGTGKTTYVQGITEGLGATTPATSPSFILIHEYPFPGGVFRHLDLYRLSDPTLDVDRIGLPELLSDSSAITAVEWADRVPLLPARSGRTIHVEFLHGARPTERVIRMSP